MEKMPIPIFLSIDRLKRSMRSCGDSVAFRFHRRDLLWLDQNNSQHFCGATGIARSAPTSLNNNSLRLVG